MPTVERIGRTQIGPAARRTQANGAFTLSPGSAERAGIPCPAGALTAAGLSALLEEAGDPPQDRAARRHGRAVLAALSALQGCVLAADAPAGLTRLAELLDEAPAPATPALAAALDAVLLRARIELVRYGR